MGKLIELSAKDNKHVVHLYQWDKDEHQKHLFTCRPVKPLPEYDHYKTKLTSRLTQGNRVFIFTDKQEPI